jgi:1,4-dihydroxy-6-naphthoate synthase
MQEQVNNSTIAIPGEDTTAHFLFSQAFPNAKNKLFMRFDAIETFVLEGKGLGVIIHENRFTYHQKGLHKIIDLGEYWEQSTGNPIPLGGIVAKRTLDASLIQSIDALIRQSLEYAIAHYPNVTEYVRCHAQEMSEAVMRQHIDLYVNEYSLSLGTGGKAAVQTLIKTFVSHNEQSLSIFI